jgi:hypothetical protein
MDNEPCLAELEAIVKCSNTWTCKMKPVEKDYVNCVIRQICPTQAYELQRSKCVKHNSLDLRRDASDGCKVFLFPSLLKFADTCFAQELWRLMDVCLIRATDAENAHLVSVLGPRNN